MRPECNDTQQCNEAERAWLTQQQSAAVDLIFDRAQTHKNDAIAAASIGPQEAPQIYARMFNNDILTILPREWVSDGILDAYGRLMQRQATALGRSVFILMRSLQDGGTQVCISRENCYISLTKG